MQDEAPKGYILYDSIYMTFWKGRNCTDGKQVNSSQVLGRRSGWQQRGMPKAHRNQPKAVIFKLSMELLSSKKI